MDGSVILDLGVLVKEGVGGGHMATSMRQKVEEQISFRQSTNLVKNLLRCGLVRSSVLGVGLGSSHICLVMYRIHAGTVS